MASKALKNLDLYGKTIGFEINGQSKLRSVPGAVVSLFTYMFVLLLMS